MKIYIYLGLSLLVVVGLVLYGYLNATDKTNPAGMPGTGTTNIFDESIFLQSGQTIVVKNELQVILAAVASDGSVTLQVSATTDKADSQTMIFHAMGDIVPLQLPPYLKSKLEVQYGGYNETSGYNFHIYNEALKAAG